MQKQTLIRAAGLSASLGGALRLATSFITLESGTSSELVYLLIDLLLLFGVIGIYARHWQVTGIAGLAGFLGATAGAALIAGPDAVLGGVDLYVVGATMLALGLNTLSLTCWLMGDGRVWIAVTLASATALGWTGYLTQFQSASVISGALFGAGMIGFGATLDVPHLNKHHVRR